MSGEILEEITFKEGNFVKVKDGSKVFPKPLGNPEAFLSLGFDDLYSEDEIHKRVVAVAEEQKLINKANAYSATQKNVKAMSNEDPLLAIQLYRI